MDDNSLNFRIKTENLAYWFFRLNGCFCLVNFLIHHENRGREGTDIDVMAARFAFRSELELSGEPMRDHPVFDSNGKVDLIIAEVKLGLCNLNGPWTNPELRNMDRFLYAIGAFQPKDIKEAANALYRNQFYENENYRLRLFALGASQNPALPSSVVQLVWEEVLNFIHFRFNRYERYKAQHRQWDYFGRLLFRLATQNRRSPEQFAEIVIRNLIS